MKTLAHGVKLPKIQINSCRSKSKSRLWFHCSPLYHCTSALKPDAVIKAVKVLAVPAQIPFQVQALASLCRCTWGQNLATRFLPHTSAPYHLWQVPAIPLLFALLGLGKQNFTPMQYVYSHLWHIHSHWTGEMLSLRKSAHQFLTN